MFLRIIVRFHFLQTTMDAMFSTLSQNIDMEKGGTKGSMKFPMPSIWEYLLQYNYLNKNQCIKSC